MSDCESQISNPNVFTFQNVNTTISARGPNTNIKNMSFRNNQSSIGMPRNFERQKYAGYISDQRSIYYRRETSPMSTFSVCDFRPRNFQPYYEGSGSKSVVHGRGGSPVSTRTMDSTTSFTASEIAFAFRNVKYNSYEMQIIKDAYKKMMKQSFRKRIERQRNRLFLKGSKHRSGDDSGEQGSDSSISSDDCRSVRSSYKENTARSRTDLLMTKTAGEDRNMFLEKFKRHPFTKMSAFSSDNLNRNSNVNKFLGTKQPLSTSSQINRFRNGFVLPSHRFNRSVASSVIQENSEKHNKTMEYQNHQNNKFSHTSNQYLQNSENGSDEEIFSNVNRTVGEKNANNGAHQNQNKKISHLDNHRKRSLDVNDDLNIPNKKKRKISPVKNIQSKNVPLKANNPVNLENHKNFEFAKPILPVRKSKQNIQEKIIAKSKQPLTGFVEPIVTNIASEPAPVEPNPNQERVNDTVTQIDHSNSLESSNISMRPSFIKRKLFTQKLDAVYKQANTSNDGTESPQNNVYSALQKEKNKARKLVTSQSCLNRDIQEDNNLLDLIHKIVAADSINVTNVNKANHRQNDVDKKINDDERWDVASIITTCNEDDCSDTYTDEDIFKTGNRKKDTRKNTEQCTVDTNKKCDVNANSKTSKYIAKINNNDCSVVIENLTNCKNMSEILNTKRAIDVKKNSTTHANVGKSIINSGITFWDTDFESDMESPVTLSKRNVQRVQTKVSDNKILEASKPQVKQPDLSSMSKNPVPETSLSIDIKNNNTVNNSLVTTRKLNINSLTVRSHRISRKKKCCNETCVQEIAPKTQVHNVNSTKINPIESNKKSVDKNNTRILRTPNTRTDSAQPKSNKQHLNNTRSTSKTRQQNSHNNKINPSIESNKKTVEKNNKMIKNTLNTTTNTAKSKSKKQHNNKRSTSHTRQSPRIKSLMNKMNTSINQSLNNRPIRSCRSRSQNRSLL